MRIEPKTPAVSEEMQVTETQEGTQHQTSIFQKNSDGFESSAKRPPQYADLQMNQQATPELRNEMEMRLTQSHLMGPMIQKSENLGKTVSPLTKDWQNDDHTIANAYDSGHKFGDVNESDSGFWGSGRVWGYSDLGEAGVRLYGDAGFKDYSAQAKIGAGGKIEYVGHHYDISYDSPGVNIAGNNVDLKTKVGIDAEIGMEGEMHAGISLGKNNQISVGGEGYIGASAGLEGSGSVGKYADYRAEAKGRVGLGAGFKPDVNFKNGKLAANINVGLVLGIGAQVDLGLAIDFKEVGKTLFNSAESFAKAAKGGPLGIAKFGIMAGAKLGSGAIKKAENVAKSAVKAGTNVVKGAAKTGKKVLKHFGIG